VPGMQSVGATKPTAQKRPSGHGERSLCDVRLVAAVYEPGAHGVELSDPSGQKLSQTDRAV